MPLHWPDFDLPPINLWNAPHQELAMHDPTTHRWHLRFLGLAEHVAGWSKDPSTQVGACIVRPNRTVLSLGYNGLPAASPIARSCWAIVPTNTPAPSTPR